METLTKHCKHCCLFVAALAIFMPVALVFAQQQPQAPIQSVVARTQLKLPVADGEIEIIEKGDLLNVLEHRDDSFVVVTLKGTRALVTKETASPLAESIEIYNVLIEEHPKQGRLLTLRASAWWARGELEKALADYDKAIELGYREAHSYSSRGLFHAALGNYKKAIDDFSTAIYRGAKDDAPFINRAAVYLSLRKYDLAMKDYGEAIRRSPANPTTYNLRAALYKTQGKLDEAIEDFTKAIELDPNNIQALMGRGFVWFQKDYRKKAIEDFSAVIKINPSSARAFNNRGYNYQLIGKYKESLADYEEAIRLAPKFALALQNKAWLLATVDDAKIRDGKGAIEAAKSACELNKYTVIGDIKALAAAYAEDKQFENAIQWQLRAIEVSSEAHKKEEQEILEKFRANQPIRLADFESDK